MLKFIKQNLAAIFAMLGLLTFIIGLFSNETIYLYIGLIFVALTRISTTTYILNLLSTKN